MTAMRELRKFSFNEHVLEGQVQCTEETISFSRLKFKENIAASLTDDIDFLQIA